MSTVIRSGAEHDLEAFYPSSDGKPMAETTIHVQTIILLFQALQDFFREVNNVFVAANLFWYWEEGNPQARRSPDVMVVKGVAKRERRSFMSWLENQAIPAAIFEIASEGTWRAKLYEKRRLYAELRVPEYFLYDPEAAYLRPALLGYRRNEQGIYVPLEADAEDRLYSEQLRLYMRGEGLMLRLIDASTGQLISTREEQATRVRQLEAEVARLRALLDQGGTTDPR